MVAGRIFNTIFHIVLPLFASAIFLSGCGLDPGIQGTIGSSDKPNITISDLTLNEGASGHLVLTSSIPLPNELIVNYSTTSVTASAGVDYTAVSDSLTIAAGSVSASIAIVLPVTDGVYEGTETFSVAFSAPPSVKLLNITRIVTILDLDLPDQAPVLDVIADQTVNENLPIVAVDAADGFDDFDVDGDAITYSCWYDVVSDGAVAETTLCSSLTGVSFVVGTGVFNWTPDLTQAGVYEFMIKGSEGDLSDTEIFVITVVDVEPFVWTGASGVDNNWSTAANWSSLTVPGPTEIAKFKNACSGAQCNVTVDVSFDVLGIDMQSTYTGTITQAAGLTPVIGASGWTQAGGTYLSPSGGNMDLTGNIVITGGAFGPTCPRVRMHTGVTLIQAVAGAWACSGSTVQGWGTGSLTVDVAGGDFRVFRYNRNPPADINIVGTLRMGWLDGAMAGNAWNGGVVELHSEGISGGASINGGTATIRIVDDRPTGITGNAGGTLILPNVEIVRSGTVNNFSFGDKIYITGNLTYTSGNFSAGTSTVIFSGSGNQTINLGAKSLNNVEFQKTAGAASITGTLDVNGNLIVNNSGTADVTGNVNLAGNYTMTANSSFGPNVRFDGTGVQTITSSLALGALTLDKVSGRVSQGSNITLDAGLDILFAQSGLWDMNGYNLTVDAIDAGAATGTIYKGCGTLTYNSTAGTVQVYDGTYGSAISIADAADVTENDATDVSQEFVVSVSPLNCVATTFDYATAAGTAVSPADFTAITVTSANIPANTASVTLTVVTKPDAITESNESYTVSLSNVMAGVNVADSSGQGVILDDDAVPPVAIYRSVGAATQALVCGSASSLIFASGTATFAQTLPNNVGVGDVVRFDADSSGNFDGVVMITERVNDTTYKVQLPNGAAPPDMVQTNAYWDIFRAYNSLADAENGTESPLIFNDPACGGPVPCEGGSCAALANFDSWSGGRDLVANNEQWNLAMYADATEDSETFIDGWTTAVNNYLRIYTPVSASEVGASQRHNGVMGSGYKLHHDGGGVDWGSPIWISGVNYVRIDGVQIKQTNVAGGVHIFIENLAAQSEIIISNSIFEGGGGAVQGITDNALNASAVVKLVNNIVYDFTYCISFGIGHIFAYNNTIANCDYGIYSGTSNFVAKNNIVQNGHGGGYSDIGDYFHASSTNNLTSDPSAPGSNPRTNKTVQFVNAAAKDFRLDITDTEAIGFGFDLSADTDYPFNTDITGSARPPTWDIGASNAVP